MSEPISPLASAPRPPGPDALPAVSRPGMHHSPDGPLEISTAEFAEDVLCNILPSVQLYRMAPRVGRLVGPAGSMRFEELDADSTRLMIDRSVRIVATKETAEHALDVRYVPCTKDLAGLVLAEGKVSPLVREISQIHTYPVYLPGFVRAQPGWNAANGVFYDEPPDLANIEPRTEGALDVLDDLTIDFVLKDEPSRQNCYAAMLTRLMRPGIEGPIPFFFTMAPLERTGKGKLIDTTSGYAISGAAVPPIQLSTNEAEIEKRITAKILAGVPILHFDNWPAGTTVDSPALASLATAWPRWGGRRLGRSETIDLPNFMIVHISGNNPRATREIVLRSVPIVMQPKDGHPELRKPDDYQHPDPVRYALERRRRVLEACLGMVEAWLAAGRPAPPRSAYLGGFERWSEAVCGVLWFAGATQVLGNYASWCACADDDSADADKLIELWAVRTGTAALTPKQILQLVKDADVYRDVQAKPTEQGQLVSLARKVLTPLTDRPVRGWIVRRMESGSSSSYCLVKACP